MIYVINLIQTDQVSNDFLESTMCYFPPQWNLWTLFLFDSLSILSPHFLFPFLYYFISIWKCFFLSFLFVFFPSFYLSALLSLFSPFFMSFFLLSLCSSVFLYKFLKKKITYSSKWTMTEQKRNEFWNFPPDWTTWLGEAFTVKKVK